MEVVQPLIQYGAPSLAVVKIVHDVTGHSITPLSGYQYAKAGAECLDGAIEILTGPQGANMDDDIRQEYLQKSNDLIPTRRDVLENTKSYVGSALNWGAARSFYIRADKLQVDTQSTSQKANVDKSLQDIKQRKLEEASSWERDEVQLRARRRQVEEAALSTPSSAPAQHNQPSLGSTFPSLQALTPAQHPSNQALVYPPAVYHPANSTHC